MHTFIQIFCNIDYLSVKFETGHFLLLSFLSTTYLNELLYCIHGYYLSILPLKNVSVSSNLQSIISKLYLNILTANVPVAIILFLAFNSDFSIVLNLVVYTYSFFNLSFIC
jgi:hypothetical protein